MTSEDTSPTALGSIHGRDLITVAGKINSSAVISSALEVLYFF
jgi:hypothetical protein